MAVTESCAKDFFSKAFQAFTMNSNDGSCGEFCDGICF